MRKKTRKFASGGDILNTIGAGMLGYALYKKLKGEDKDEKKPEAVGGAGRRPRTIEEQIGRKAEPKAETKEEYLEKRGAKPLQETGTRENPLYKEDEDKPKPAPKKVTPKAEKTKNVTPAAQDTSGEAPAKLGSQGNFKFSSKNFAPKGTQSVGETLGMVKPGEAKGTQTLGERIKGTMDSAGKSVVRTPQQRMADAAREVEERRKKESGMRRGGAVKKYASGGSVGSASKRADGIAQRGKTKGRIC
jgi:hypothetical protein